MRGNRPTGKLPPRPSRNVTFGKNVMVLPHQEAEDQGQGHTTVPNEDEAQPLDGTLNEKKEEGRSQ